MYKDVEGARIYMKVIKVRDDIYFHDLTVAICKYDKANKYLKRFGIDEDDLDLKECSGKTFFLDSGRCGIWIDGFNWLVAEQGLLMHEILHYCFAVFRDLPIEIDGGSEEAFTYYVQSVMCKVWKAL